MRLLQIPNATRAVLNSFVENSIHPEKTTNHALGIALLSYAGGLFWGLHADWDAVPDLHDLADDVEASFEQLRKAAHPGPDASRLRSRPRARKRARA
jgi:hypothetical protein